MPQVKFKDREVKDGVKIEFVSQETLDSIMDIIRNTKIGPSSIHEIGGIVFKKGDFIGIKADTDEVLNTGYDITNSEHRRILLDFKRFLENLKRTKILNRDLSYYGNPSTNLGEGMVHNPILGFVHWTEVDYGEQERFVGRYAGGNWFIALDGTPTGQKAAARRYDGFNAKRRGLQALADEEYAKKKELEDQNKALKNL
jgi:hypothetical protein